MTATAGVDGSTDQPMIRVMSPTEVRNNHTLSLDRLSTLAVLELINDEDAVVAQAVRAVLPQIAQVVDLAVAAIDRGRQVHYVGAGTSGRLGVMDAAELAPTFAASADWVVAHHAGGPQALLRAVEDVEDDEDAGRREVCEDVEDGDVVIGLTASGRTPYVAGALRAARECGATTVLVTANPNSPLESGADVFVGFDTGPEVLTGSTRMKAGTAQKLILNAFSTALMVRLGRTYSNLMVDMVATNAKLRGRTLQILMDATGEDEGPCAEALARCGGELKTALVTVLSGADPVQARSALQDSGGHVHAALDQLRTAG